MLISIVLLTSLTSKSPDMTQYGNYQNVFFQLMKVEHKRIKGRTGHKS